MIAATAILSIVAFIWAMGVFGLVRVATDILAVSHNAYRTMQDKKLDDLARERAVQQASFKLMYAFGSMLLRGVLSLLVAVLPIWLASMAGLVRFEEVVDFLSRWDVIIAATVVITVGYILWSKWWRSR